MSEESPIYGATNHDIIWLAKRITDCGTNIKALTKCYEQLAPLLINISARLEALEDKVESLNHGVRGMYHTGGPA